jgi:hypothetical protein
MYLLGGWRGHIVTPNEWHSVNGQSWGMSNPRCSMYSIFTYICAICWVNVGKYSIHGAYGNILEWFPANCHNFSLPKTPKPDSRPVDLLLGHPEAQPLRQLRRRLNAVGQQPVAAPALLGDRWARTGEVKRRGRRPADDIYISIQLSISI